MNFNKYTAAILSCLFIFNFITPLAIAETSIQPVEEKQKVNISFTERAIPESIEKEMKDCIKNIWQRQGRRNIFTHIYACSKSKSTKTRISFKR